MKKRLLAILLFATTIVSAQVRQEITLSEGWMFSQDKKSWRNVIIPHDWAIAGPFDKKWDLQKVAIEQNGETEATEKSGRSGALPWIGEGHYKRTITIPQDFKGHAELLFDGAMAEPTVSIDGLEGTARVFMPGKNCYACNLGPEGQKDLARRMPCSGIIRRQEQAGSAPTTSIVASVIGAVQVQEALKLIHREELETGRLTSLCGRMFYYDGEHLTTRTADFVAYDEDCPEHEQWTPIRQTQVKRQDTVGKTLQRLSQELGDEEVTISLTQDCYVDYVARRDNDERTFVMCPGRAVEEATARDKVLQGFPLSALYQHEYRRIDKSFPYQELTLTELGIPPYDVLRVSTEKGDYYLEIKEV